MSQTDENKKLVLKFMELFSANDLENGLAMMSDDATWWVGGKKEMFPLAGKMTKTEFRALLDNMFGLLPEGLKLIPKSLIAEGDKVAVECKSYGPSTRGGRVYENEYHFLFEVRDGKIQAVREYLDTMHTKWVFLDPL